MTSTRAFGKPAVRIRRAPASFSPTFAADVPSHVRHDPGARLNFFIETMKELLAQGKFRGRQCVQWCVPRRVVCV